LGEHESNKKLIHNTFKILPDLQSNQENEDKWRLRNITCATEGYQKTYWPTAL